MNKLVELCKTKIGCGYVWGGQGEVLTEDVLKNLVNNFGKEHYVLSDGTRADKWLGKQVFDCSGLIIWALNKSGLEIPDDTANGLYHKYCEPISFNNIKDGDLVFRQNKNSGEIVHVGIYSGNGNTIEAKSTSSGVVQGRAIDFNMYGRLKFDLDIPESFDSKLVQSLIKIGSNSPHTWVNDFKKGKFDNKNVKGLLKLIVNYFDK